MDDLLPEPCRLAPILGAGLFLEEKVYFWSVRLRRQKRNMQKKKEKQACRRKKSVACMQTA
jgi:hypothetical protein